MTKEKMVIVSGYFNPVHRGHIDYFVKARACGHKLCVIVNSDFQRELKGSKKFMFEAERLLIVKSLKPVDVAEISIDRDRTVCETLRRITVCLAGSMILRLLTGAIRQIKRYQREKFAKS